MRALLVIIILVLVLMLLGWLRFSSPSGQPTIQLDTGKMQQDAEHVIESTEEAARDAAHEIDEHVEGDRIVP